MRNGVRRGMQEGSFPRVQDRPGNNCDDHNCDDQDDYDDNYDDHEDNNED